MPFVTKAEVTGSYRWVKNSLAGKNDAWSYGGRLTLFQDLTLRATKSSTFRAPSPLELFLPRSSVLQSPGLDPATRPTSPPGGPVDPPGQLAKRPSSHWDFPATTS